jgi:amidase
MPSKTVGTEVVDLTALAQQRRDALPQPTRFNLFDVEALIAPAMSPAWLTDPALGDHFVGAGYGAAAVAGTPSITVPMGEYFGLPVGIVFMGPAWSEARLIELGYAFEQLTRARKPPRFLPTVELTQPRGKT